MNTNTELLLDIAHFKFRNSLQSYEYIIKEIYDGTLYNELNKPYIEIQTDTAGTPISSSGIITEGRLSSLYRNADLDFFFKDDGWVVDFMQNIDLFHTEIEKKIAAYLNKKFNDPNHDKIMDEIKNREKYKSLIADLGVIFKMFGFKKEKDIQEFYDKVISLTNTSKLSNTTADADLLTKTSLPEIDSFNITNHKAKNTDEENLKIRAFDTIFMYFSYIAVLLDNICFEYLQENVKVIAKLAAEKAAAEKAATNKARVAPDKAAVDKAAADKALAEANAKLAAEKAARVAAEKAAKEKAAAEKAAAEKAAADAAEAEAARVALQAQLNELQTQLTAANASLAAQAQLLPQLLPVDAAADKADKADKAAADKAVAIVAAKKAAEKAAAEAEAEAARLAAAAEAAAAEAEAARLAAEYTYNKFLTEHIDKTTKQEKDNLDKSRKIIELLSSVDSIVGTHKDYTTVNSDGYNILAYMDKTNKENLINIKKEIDAIDTNARNNNLNDIITNFNNKIDEKYKRNNVLAIYKYKDVAVQLITDIKTFKIDIADLDAKIKAIQEDLFKIPYMIVKMIDDKDIITGGGKTDEGDNYLIKDPNSNCVIIGETCQLESVDAGTIFGPYNHVLAPTNDSQNKLTNPTNKQIFDNLTTGGYNIIQKIQAGKCIKLFGYGFSGSGKTYTLLDTGESSTEQSLFILLLNHLKNNVIPKYDKLTIQIAVYYPHFENKIGNYTDETSDELKISRKMTANMDEFKNELDKANVELAKLTDPQNILEKIRDFNKNVMKKYAYILPTKNNHESSRAFTIVNIQNSGKNLIQFIDLPGIEKKVDMIKDYFFPKENAETIKNEIEAKKTAFRNSIDVYYKESKGEKYYNHDMGSELHKSLTYPTSSETLKHDKQNITANKHYTTRAEAVDIFNTQDDKEEKGPSKQKISYSEQIFYFANIKNTEEEQKTKKQVNTLQNAIYTNDGKVDFSSVAINTHVYTDVYQKIFGVSNFENKFKRYNKHASGVAGGVMANKTCSLFFLKLESKKSFINKVIKKLFNYLNYTTKIKLNYLYTIKYFKIQECINNFEREFIIDKANNFSIEKIGSIKYMLINSDETVEKYKYIFEKIFLFDIDKEGSTTKNDDKMFIFGANVKESSNGKGVKQTPVFNKYYEDFFTRTLDKEYKSPVLTVIAMIFKYIDETQSPDILNEQGNTTNPEYSRLGYDPANEEKDKLFHKAIFLTLLVNFITDQGQEIVTSLEHLLFEFLIQNPMGIKKYNEGIDQLKKKDKPAVAPAVAPVKNLYIDRKFENPFADPNLTGLTHHDKIVTLCKDINTYMKDFAKGSKYKIVSQYSGMEETITRKYLPGVHDVLKIDKDSRFINVLTILRRKGKLDTKTNKFEMEDATKRCQGAINTLVFGELLSGDFGCNSVRKYPILEKPPRDTRTQLNQDANPRRAQLDWLTAAEKAVAQTDEEAPAKEPAAAEAADKKPDTLPANSGRWLYSRNEEAAQAAAARAKADQKTAVRTAALRRKLGGKFKSRKPSKSKSKSKSKSNNRSKIRKKDLILLNRKNKIKRIATLKKYNMK